jgi:carbon storage regulator
MLVVSRRKNERVYIEGVGWVMVLEIRGDKVRLGFEVDKNRAVHRGEVQAQIDEKRKQIEQEAAADE